jgi:competence protein ComEA
VRGCLITIALCCATPLALAQPVRESVPAVELNTAGYDELAALPGVGDAFAPRIIEGRPYAAKHELLTRRIVPRATYVRIKHRICAEREPIRFALHFVAEAATSFVISSITAGSLPGAGERS